MPKRDSARDMKKKVVSNHPPKDKRIVEHEISLKIFWPCAIILCLAFIFTFINLSNTVLHSYPPNDFADHLAQIKSTYEFGLENNVTYWNNGQFVAGRIYGMSWYTAGAAINHITHDSRVSFIALELLLFIIGYFGVYLYGRIKGYTIGKSSLFYILFFLSPLAIAYFLGLGSVGSLFGWSLIFFIIAILEYYMSRDIDWRFLAIVPFYSIIILSHMYMAIISSIIIGCFMIYRIYLHMTQKMLLKHLKEYAIVLTSIIISMALTAFWWIDYITKYDLASRTIPFSYIDVAYTFSIGPRGTMFTFVIPIVFIAVYLLQRKNLSSPKKAFYLIPLIISVLMLTRLLSFTPVLNRIGYENMCLLIFLFALFLMFDDRMTLNLSGSSDKTKTRTKMPTVEDKKKKREEKRKVRRLKRLAQIATYAFIILSVIGCAIYAKIYYESAHFRLPETDKRAITLVEKHLDVAKKLVIIYDWAELTYPIDAQIPVHVTLNSYFAFQDNITTPQSVLWQAMDNKTYSELRELKNAVKYSHQDDSSASCDNIRWYMTKLQAQSMLIIGFDCSSVARCDGMRLVDEDKGMCLLKYRTD